MAVTLRSLAAAIGAEVDEGANATAGNAATVEHVTVSSVQTLDEAGPQQVSFLSNPKYASQLQTTRAAAVIVARGVRRPDALRNPNLVLLRSADPYFAYRQAVVKLHGFRKHPHEGVHPAAHVDPSATVGPGSVLYPGAFVGPRARLGKECILYPNAVVYDDCVLGDRVILHAGAVIGADGYGYASHRDDDKVVRHYKIPQMGNVVLEDDVEVGANAAVDRAVMGTTFVGRGTKIDNLVTIGHNVRVGEHGLIVAQVGIAGSTVVGHHVTMAGQGGIAGHLHIGDGVTLGAQAGVFMDVPDQSTLVGAPAMPAGRARRVYSIFTQLPELLDRVKKLEQAMGEMSGGDGKEDAEGV